MAAAQSVLAVVLLFTFCGAAPDLSLDDIISTVCPLFVQIHQLKASYKSTVLWKFCFKADLVLIIKTFAVEILFHSILSLYI